ncbi:MAG: STAS/SEC14 domain-containing protein [Actinobacteria bacterium]|nr:MAG: STAS/SEC14 domain-containing protein [Actinomycetota bacterium]
MIRLIEGLPSNVIGFEAVGEVESDDYKNVLDPALDAAVADHDKIRFLYVLGAEFEGYSGGAMWQDTKVGVSHWAKFERIAFVSDHKAYDDMVKAFGWMIPGKLKVFALADLADAKEWVVE